MIIMFVRNTRANEILQETVFFYIISSNNNIPLDKHCINNAAGTSILQNVFLIFPSFFCAVRPLYTICTTTTVFIPIRIRKYQMRMFGKRFCFIAQKTLGGGRKRHGSAIPPQRRCCVSYADDVYHFRKQMSAGCISPGF